MKSKIFKTTVKNIENKILSTISITEISDTRSS